MHFTLRTTPSEKRELIISVSKKVARKAVTRNLIKRRLRPILESFSLRPAKYLLIAKPGAEAVKGEALRQELKKLLS